MAFVIRKFDYHETLGDKLKAVRHSAKLTLSELALKTKIRKVFLQAFESGEYTKLPDPLYAKNFLRVYVKALGGDVDYFLEQFEKECGTCEFMDSARLPRQRTRAVQLLVASRFVKIFFMTAIASTIVLYMGLQIQGIIAPPDLVVIEPKDGSLTHIAKIRVTGVAEPDAHVRINGLNILLNQNGTFETEVNLERGLNIIAVESTKRYSHATVEYRRVMFGENQAVSMHE